MEIHTIDLKITSNWALASEHIKGERKRDDYISKFFRDSKCVCQENWRTNNDCIPINIIKRIGSDSLSGEVYLLEIKKDKIYRFAGKILPVNSKINETTNITEINIAKIASELVINGNSQFFPIVYGYSKCDNVIYDENSILYKRSYLNFLKKLINNLPVKIKNTIKPRLIKNMDIDELKKVHTECLKYIKDNVGLEPIFSAHVLFSELAWGDLKQFYELYKNNITDRQWYIIIYQIFLGINDMQEKLKIVHNDLHPGNILLLFFNDNGKMYNNCLIHDFGWADSVDIWSIKDRTYDLSTILEYLLEYTKKLKIYNNLIEVSQMIINHNNNLSLLEKVCNYWSNIKN